MSDIDDLVDVPAVVQAALTRSGEVAAVPLLEAHLARVDRCNGALNAVVDVDVEAARAQAAAADRLPAAHRGVLHGLPTAGKDLANVAGFHTTLGHRHFAGDVAAVDDLHIARMRAAGAVFYGKTNVPELGAGSHTVNAVYGDTRNPHDPRRSAGGSSGGAAAALAAGMLSVADGSDMGGSLRNPAAFCGVVGLRPTPGVVPAAGSSNMFDPLATEGPMGRTVSDVALLLSVMNGPTPLVPRTLALDHDCLLSLEPAALRGLHVAYAPDLGGRIPVDPAIRVAVDATARALEQAGAVVTAGCPDLAGADDAFRALRAASFQALWGDLQRAHPDEFNPYVTQNIIEGRTVTGPDVIRAYAEVTRLTRAAADYFGRVDILLAPTTQVLPFPVETDWPHEVAGVRMTDYLQWMRSAWLLTSLGVPAISVPVGYVGALPVGAQLVAGPGRDVDLLRVALAVERLLAVPRRTPRVPPAGEAA